MKKYWSILRNIIFDVVRKKIGKYYFVNDIRSKPLKIIIGASGVGQEGWISSDANYLNLLNKEQWYRYFKENNIEALLAEHVWEHLTETDGVLAAGICYKYLKQGWYLRVAVPDGCFPDKTYIDCVKPGGVGAGANDHKVLYTYKTLAIIFEAVGFKVHLWEYFDEEGFFHYEEWNKNDGMIFRSKKFDERNNGARLGYTSIILDATK